MAALLGGTLKFLGPLINVRVETPIEMNLSCSMFEISHFHGSCQYGGTRSAAILRHILSTQSIVSEIPHSSPALPQPHAAFVKATTKIKGLCMTRRVFRPRRRKLILA